MSPSEFTPVYDVGKLIKRHKKKYGNIKGLQSGTENEMPLVVSLKHPTRFTKRYVVKTNESKSNMIPLESSIVKPIYTDSDTISDPPARVVELFAEFREFYDGNGGFTFSNNIPDDCIITGTTNNDTPVTRDPKFVPQYQPPVHDVIIDDSVAFVGFSEMKTERSCHFAGNGDDPIIID